MSVNLAKSASAQDFSFLKTEADDFTILIDKLYERLSFQRTGTELYEALIQKTKSRTRTQVPIEKLQQIREDEFANIEAVKSAIIELGGDPDRPSLLFDQGQMATKKLLSIVEDPHSSISNSVQAILMAELADSAGWEFLMELAEDAGLDHLKQSFQKIQQKELEHLTVVKDLLKSLTRQDLEGRVG